MSATLLTFGPLVAFILVVMLPAFLIGHIWS